jgi:hypothetical protein
VTESHQQQTIAEAFRALQEYAESLSAAFSRTLIEKLIVLSHLTIDLGNEIRLVHRSHSRYRITVQEMISPSDVCDKPIQLPKCMGKDFLAAFLGHLYRTRTLVFVNVGNGTFTASLHRVKNLVDRDHYAVGLAPELLVNNAKIYVDYLNPTAFSYAQYTISITTALNETRSSQEHCLVSLLPRAPANTFNLSLGLILAPCWATHFMRFRHTSHFSWTGHSLTTPPMAKSVRMEIQCHTFRLC